MKFSFEEVYLWFYSVKVNSDFIWQFLLPYMGVIPNPKMVFIFPISCIFALIFPLFMKYFPKCVKEKVASQNPK